MIPTLEEYLKTDPATSQSAAVKSWLSKPLPKLSHRVDQWQTGDAFVLFREDSVGPKTNKEVLWVSDRVRPNFEAQLVFKDLPQSTREWSLRFHRSSIDELALIGVTGTNGKSSVVHLRRKF